MTEGIHVMAEVLAFDPGGFVEDQTGSFSMHGLALLRIVGAPGKEFGAPDKEFSIVLDNPSGMLAALRQPGTRVQLVLDPETADLDIIFSAGVLDLRVLRPGSDG